MAGSLFMVFFNIPRILILINILKCTRVSCFLSYLKGLPESKLKAFQMGRNPLKGKAPSKVKEEEKKKVTVNLFVVEIDWPSQPSQV